MNRWAEPTPLHLLSLFREEGLLTQACTNYGQRVRQSVFECTVSWAQDEQLIDDLTSVIDEEKDSLRAYRRAQPTDETVETWGLDDTMVFDESMVL